jgi:hypothetical protein
MLWAASVASFFRRMRPPAHPPASPPVSLWGRRGSVGPAPNNNLTYGVPKYYLYIIDKDIFVRSGEVNMVGTVAWNKLMGQNVVFVPSAFKHDISEENILWALQNHLTDSAIEDDDGAKFLVIGFDKSGKLLEIMYNLIGEHTIKVFHAMKCRRTFYEKLKEMEGL